MTFLVAAYTDKSAGARMNMKNPEIEKSHWSGIWALTLGVSGLMIAEFLPAGVLTPMASDLGITEGMAGQSVTATSIFAVLASLCIAYTRKSS